MKSKSYERRQPNAPIPPEQRAAPAYPVKPPPQARKAKKPTAKSRLRGISDELGVTLPKTVKRRAR
jgi:hypothetical protein